MSSLKFLIADVPLIFMCLGIAFALGVLFRDMLPKSDDTDEG